MSIDPELVKAGTAHAAIEIRAAPRTLRRGTPLGMKWAIHEKTRREVLYLSFIETKMRTNAGDRHRD